VSVAKAVDPRRGLIPHRLTHQSSGCLGQYRQMRPALADRCRVGRRQSALISGRPLNPLPELLFHSAVRS